MIALIGSVRKRVYSLRSRISIDSRKSASASSSRPCAARTSASVFRVVACELTSCGPIVSTALSA